MKKIRVLISCKGKDLKEKVMAVTRKCFELAQNFDHFFWEFSVHDGRTYFSAAYRDEDGGDRFEFPLSMVEVDERYDYIMSTLEDLKWSALLFEREEEG